MERLRSVDSDIFIMYYITIYAIQQLCDELYVYVAFNVHSDCS